MMELMKKNIHMNRQKGNAVSQITLDDDFIVPDTMDDVSQVLLDNGEIQIESSRTQGDKVLIKGKLAFRVLYRKLRAGCRLWEVKCRLMRRSTSRIWMNMIIPRYHGRLRI